MKQLTSLLIINDIATTVNGNRVLNIRWLHLL